MSATTLRKTLFLNASADIVWAYLTDKDKLGDWFHPATTRLTVGTPYVLLEDAIDPGSRLIWGDVLRAEKPAVLSYTFTVEPLQGESTLVQWVLEAAAGGTRVTLIHSGVDEAASQAGRQTSLSLLIALDKGWDEHFSRLRNKFPA